MQPIQTALCVCAVLAGPAFAQDTEQAKREAAFAKKMSGCKMVGFFTVTGRPSKQRHEESYTISKVTKLRGDKWRFNAKIEYGGRSATLPIVVSVLWAGDTPVIQVTKIPVPTMGTYTARVLIYGDHYAGFWSGGDHGGHMYGRIVKPTKKTVTDWPQFRGRGARGVADGYATPVTWDVETGENIKWKTKIPGLCHSSPVITGDRVFVTTAVKDGKATLRVGLYGNVTPVEDDSEHELKLFCLDKNSGKVLWSKTCWKGVPAIKRHPKGSHAASTPATDGKHVVAFFGSEGLYCYDVTGEFLWKKDLGRLDAGWYRMPNAQWGYGASPVIHSGKVIVQCDVQKGSFIAAYDVAGGEQVWRTARDEVPTWSTPTVDVTGGRRQVITNGWKHIGGYDLDTGKELWKVRGGGDIPVPTPVVGHGLIYITNAHGRYAPILAISTKAEGEFSMDASESEYMVWSHLRRGNYMQTPIVYDNELYCCNDAGVVTCLDAKTGERIYRERIGGGRMGFTGSGIAADGKLYFTSEDGEVHVLKAGRKFEELALNEFGETFMSSPAASAGTLFFRTRSHVIAIAKS